MGVNTRLSQGFTLAEVLITLSIIGVVAALTIPSLIVKNQEKQTVVQLKKAYNVLSNAFSLAKVEYGDPSGWGWADKNSLVGAINGLDKLAPFLNLIRRCNEAKGCYPADFVYKYYDGTTWGAIDNSQNSARAILADGTMLLVWSAGYDPNFPYNPYAAINIDVNGFKGPNTVGKDCFEFYIAPKGLIPAGAQIEGISEENTISVKNNCKDSDGRGCTAWVLTKENLDYPPKGQEF